MLARSASFIAAASILVRCASFAQPDISAEPPTLRTTASNVIIDIAVKQSGSQSVTGLRKVDFQVFEDGKPQTVDFFEEHTVKALLPGALGPLLPIAPNVSTNVPPAPGLSLPPDVFAAIQKSGVPAHLEIDSPTPTSGSKLVSTTGTRARQARLKSRCIPKAHPMRPRGNHHRAE